MNELKTPSQRPMCPDCKEHGIAILDTSEGEVFWNCMACSTYIREATKEEIMEMIPDEE